MHTPTSLSSMNPNGWCNRWRAADRKPALVACWWSFRSTNRHLARTQMRLRLNFGSRYGGPLFVYRLPSFSFFFLGMNRELHPKMHGMAVFASCVCIFADACTRHNYNLPAHEKSSRATWLISIKKIEKTIIVPSQQYYHRFQSKHITCTMRVAGIPSNSNSTLPKTEISTINTWCI